MVYFDWVGHKNIQIIVCIPSFLAGEHQISTILVPIPHNKGGIAEGKHKNYDDPMLLSRICVFFKAHPLSLLCLGITKWSISMTHTTLNNP